jgi:hypothetical protein
VEHGIAGPLLHVVILEDERVFAQVHLNHTISQHFRTKAEFLIETPAQLAFCNRLRRLGSLPVISSPPSVFP